MRKEARVIKKDKEEELVALDAELSRNTTEKNKAHRGSQSSKTIKAINNYVIEL